MSYWVGRFIHTDDGEHGQVLDRAILRRLPRRELVKLIEAKDVELVEWDGQGLEIVSEEYLADEGTHVSVSAGTVPPPRPKLVRLLTVALTLVSISIGLGLVVTHPPAHPRAVIVPGEWAGTGTFTLAFPLTPAGGFAESTIHTAFASYVAQDVSLAESPALLNMVIAEQTPGAFWRWSLPELRQHLVIKVQPRQPLVTRIVVEIFGRILPQVAGMIGAFCKTYAVAAPALNSHLYLPSPFSVSPGPVVYSQAGYVTPTSWTVAHTELPTAC